MGVEAVHIGRENEVGEGRGGGERRGGSSFICYAQ